MVMVLPDHAALIPAGKPFAPDTPLFVMPVAPVVVWVILVIAVLILTIGEEDAAVTVRNGFTETVLVTVVGHPIDEAGAELLHVLALLLVTVCTPLPSVSKVADDAANNKSFVFVTELNGKLGTVIVDWLGSYNAEPTTALMLAKLPGKYVPACQ
jgi:hypothetical protein